MATYYENDIYEGLKRYTYPALLRDALNSVPGDVDKREGSIIYDALAPLCMMLAKSFDVLHQVASQSRFQTAQGEYLDLCGAQFGIYRAPATHAKWSAKMLPSTVVVETGHVFVSSEGMGFEYEVVSSQGNGDYTVMCKTAGAEGGADFGVLHPMPPIAGLESAVLTECVDRGSDVQSDDDYRIKIWHNLSRRGYGGNFDDYSRWIFETFREAQNDVATVISGFQIYPAWNGGGTVKINVVQDFVHERYSPASGATVSALKAFLDPVSPNGSGIVPLGHRVTVEGFDRYKMGFRVPLLLRSGAVLDSELKGKIIHAVKGYFEGLREDALTNPGDPFPDGGYRAQFYVSGLSSAIISCDTDKIAGIADSGILKRESNGTYFRKQEDVVISSTSGSAVLPYFDELLIHNEKIYPEV